MPKYRSATTTHGRNMAGARALWRATGMTDADFGKPIIAVVNSFTQFVPGHVHLRDLGKLVAEQIEAAGGVAKEFNTIAVDDGIAMGHGGMLYSLPSRELIADSVEYMVNAHCADAMVCISNCDKITPGMLMASLRLNIPVIFVSGGPMEAGKTKLSDKIIKLDLVDAMIQGADPKVSDSQSEQVERSACPTCGSCSGMFTANSMNCLTEALGLSQPGNGSLLATHADRKELFLTAGQRIVELTKRYYEQDDASALPRNIAKMQADLAKYGIQYDEWFLESKLHNDGELNETIQILKDKGLTYDKEGALWYRATTFGAEKDEVLVRQNGNPTYFAADIAYHRNKFAKRGFDRCIDVWGADHHGHVARMKAAMDAVGLDGSKLDIVLIQLVRLVRNGEVVRMSKRTGKAIQLADLLDEVPVDAARFLFNMREATSQMDFDLDLAVQQDAQNPVYYVQYAHARICSILKALKAEGIEPRACSDEELSLLNTQEEIDLIRHLSAYTDEIVAAAKDYDPARITRYVITLANLFHKFYNTCRVKDEEDRLRAARICLCKATATVIRNVLSLLKISAPESM